MRVSPSLCPTRICPVFVMQCIKSAPLHCTMRAVLLHAVAAAALQPNEVWHSIKQQASVAATSPLSAPAAVPK